MNETATDGELVRRAQQGERAARDQLVRRWSPRVLAFCHARVRNRHLAEDLAQETLLRGMRAIRTLQAPERFGAWLRGIALRVYADWRKSKEAGQLPFTAIDCVQNLEGLMQADGEPVETAAERADELRRLMREVESLKEEYREVLMLYYYEQVTYRDLAELLGVSTATINARLTKARAALRRRLSSSPRQTHGL